MAKTFASLRLNFPQGDTTYFSSVYLGDPLPDPNDIFETTALSGTQNYTFIGWCHLADGTDTIYSIGDNTPYEVMYAIWEIKGFLNKSGVKTLSGQIKTLADATYAPLDHIHSEANGTSIASTSITASTSAWVGSSKSFTTTDSKLVYIYCGVRVAGVGLDEATGQTRPRTFLYESDHARRSPVYFLPAGTYYPYVKGTSAGSVTVSIYEITVT